MSLEFPPPPTASPSPSPPNEAEMWRGAEAYERFMGHWSRQVAVRFLETLGMPPAARWCDVGCGIGSLTATIIDRCAPAEVVGVDPTPVYLRWANERLASPTVRFEEAPGERLPLADERFDAVVSGLALNFMQDTDRGLAEMLRVTRPGGVVGAYVWDYDYGDFFLSRLWQAVTEADGRPAPTDERGRWRICSPSGLAEVAERSGLRDWHVGSIEISTAFASADELWESFLLGVGPTGAWVTGLSDHGRVRLRERLLDGLPRRTDGQVHLTARALVLAGRRLPVAADGDDVAL